MTNAKHNNDTRRLAHDDFQQSGEAAPAGRPRRGVVLLCSGWTISLVSVGTSWDSRNGSRENLRDGVKGYTL